MFKFNDNDRKYIIKRVIAYVIISLLSYFLFTSCAHALTLEGWGVTNIINGSSNSYNAFPDSFKYNNQWFNTSPYAEFGLFGGGEHTINVNYYFANPCGQGESMTYTSVMEFYKTGSNDLVFDSVKTVNAIDGCQGYWNWSGSGNAVYVSTCALRSGPPRVSVYFNFDSSYAINPNSWDFVREDSSYRVALNDFSVSCQINSASIIDNASANASSIINNQNNNTQQIINNQNEHANQQHHDQQAIHNDLSSEDNDATSNKCGIICKFKWLINFLSPSNLIHLIVPTQEDWSSVIANANDAITNRLGVVGVVLNVSINVLNILTNNSGLTNYCISWNAIQVPNFNQDIIPSGQWCIDTYFQDGPLKAFADVCRVIIGGLTCFAFLSYIQKIYKKILDIPITRDDEYEYISSSDWQMAHVDFNGDNDYQVFGRRNTTTTRKRV